MTRYCIFLAVVLAGAGRANAESITGPVTSLTIVPEPSALVLAVVGLLGLIVHGRRNTAGRV